MTFYEDGNNDPVLALQRQEKRKQVENLIPAGFMATPELYRHYEIMAQRLYNKMISGKDEQGKPTRERMLESPDVGTYLYFCTEYFEQSFSMFENMGGFDAVQNMNPAQMVNFALKNLGKMMKKK